MERKDSFLPMMAAFFFLASLPGVTSAQSKRIDDFIIAIIISGILVFILDRFSQ